MTDSAFSMSNSMSHGMSHGTLKESSNGAVSAAKVLSDTIHGRRSIRRYQDRPIPRDVLERLLNAAVYAPSAHNRQPWRFAVLTDFDTRRTLALAMGARLRSDLMADKAPPEVIEKDVARSYSRITNAPAIIIVCTTMADMDRYPDERRTAAESLMAAQSTAMAVQNLLLSAHAEGLGACWMCAPLFVPDIVRDTLGLPDDWNPQAMITLGYPAEDKQGSKQSLRHPLESRVIWK
jgi:coenzyme F420-0:L-glutamate ligase / coenzyme F420-1:gamma-L-glutamate ligase